MNSLIKGLKVTVDVVIKANEIATCKFRRDEGRDRRDEKAYKGLDLSASAGIELAESNSELDLREILDLLHDSLKESIEDQAKEYLNEAQTTPESDYEKEIRHNTGE